MSRWDEKDNDHNRFDEVVDEEQESHLLKTFHDYTSLQIKEAEKIRKGEFIKKSNSGTWTYRFIISSLIQIFIISALTIVLAATDLTNSEVNFMEFLLLSMEGPAKLFVFGYTSYFVLVVGISVTGIFYNFLETSLKKKIVGQTNILAWIHLVGLNLGGTMSVFFLIWGGLIGAGIVDFGVTQSNQFDLDGMISESLNPFFVGSLSLLAISCIVGATLYFTLLIQHSKQSFLGKNSRLFSNKEISEFEKL